MFKVKAIDKDFKGWASAWLEEEARAFEQRCHDARPRIRSAVQNYESMKLKKRFSFSMRYTGGLPEARYDKDSAPADKTLDRI